ncbi:MAG: EamA family transporter [Oscillospiraceae bacterium]|nr:EamA family transporter [Oscillospiraceae bacterium]
MEEKQNKTSSMIMMIVSLLIVGTIGLFRRFIPLSSPMLAFSRGLIGGTSLLIFLLVRGRKRLSVPRGRTLLALIVNGVFLGVNWILLFEAFDHTTIAKATLCYYLQPMIVILLSPLVFGEKLTLRRLLCAAVALGGMVLLSGVFGAGGDGGDLKGILFGLGAACFYALVVIVNKKIQGVGMYERTVVQLLSCAVVLIPYLLLTEDLAAIVITTDTLLLLLIVGVVHTGLAYVLYFGSMRDLPAQTISVLSYIDPIVAMFVSVVVLSEPLEIGGVIGAVMILGAAVVGELPHHNPGE